MISLKLTSVATAFCLVFSGYAVMAQDTLPETPAGKRLGQLLDLVNGTDEEQLDKFLAEGFDVRDEETVKRRKQQTTQVRDQFGILTVTEVTASSDSEITAKCSTANGPVIDLTITVTSEAPHRIESVALAMGDDGPTDTGPLTTDQRIEAIGLLARELRAKYVYPKVGEEMAASAEKALEAGDYDEITSANVFAQKLTAQLRSICQDKHLGIRAGGPRPPSSRPGRRPEDNFGFVKAEFLSGGIGYLKFNYFAGDDAAEKTAAAAMNFLARADALIFDLRQNGGGSPEMIAFLSGYLFDKKVHLNSFYNRPTETTTETWTREDVPGQEFGESKPVYVLTSSSTFSGAEEFSYNLKNLKRGVIVGETTGGGAHPVMSVQLGTRLSMRMPFARAINPITNTNWEGVGVKPDVEVPAAEALEKAIELARAAIADNE